MDCTSNCRHASHADVVLSAVTREELNHIKCFVKYFCGNGARVCDSFGRNALHVAASCGRKDVLKWLLEQRGQVGQRHGIGNKDSESGWTALHRSCFYGYLSCAVLLLQYGANIYEKDVEGISPVELLMLDSPRKAYSRELNYSSGRKKQPDSKGACVDISSWGRNTNFTLGHGDERERYIPEIIDVFARKVKISIQDIVICKFHSIILAENGSVWTCGHGQGGRLGHGHEKTILVPKKIDALANHTCIAVAAGQDHSVVLCENGNVFTFGLNNHHQMGHHPPASQYLSPKQIQAKPFKDKKFVGIAAGKYHTILYTRKEVYSCGLNSGQLGHSKGDRTQILPRQISALHLKDASISLVACNDAAMACVTDSGDVHLIYQYTQRKIISKFSNISKLLVIGGRLDDSHFKEVTESKCSQVIIYGLCEDGKVFQWRQNDKGVRECHWSLQKALSVVDIACGKNLHIVTAQGEVYFEEGMSASVKKPTKILPRNLNFVSYSHVLKQDEIIEVFVTRVPHLHRVVRIVCDEHSQNFAALQADPLIGCTITPKITPPEMKEHLAVLFEDAQFEDSVHDIEIKVKGRSLAAHKLILAEGSEKFRSLIAKAEATFTDDTDDLTGGIPVISLDDEDFEAIREAVEFLYTGSCASLRPLKEEDRPGAGFEEDETEMLSREEMMLNELAWSFEDIDFEVLYNLQVPLLSEFCGVSDEKEAVVPATEEMPSNSKRHVNHEEVNDAVPERLARRKELLRVAKKYRITELVSSLQDVTNDRKIFQKRFNRNRFTEYHDVVIEAEDNVEYACHKCILVARLEYFHNMLTAGWMESSGGFIHLKMAFPSSILKVVIDFLYTDEAPAVKESQDLEFLGKVLTVADQLWFIRLKEICEAKMASLVSLKNAVEMLEFSNLYNAEQLKNVCFEFICLNMSCLFEAGSLEFLSEDVLDELSKTYREMIPTMAWRVLTPSDIHLSVPWPQPESPTKRKGSRSQRRSRTSESDVEGRAVEENGHGPQSEIAGEHIESEENSSLHESPEKESPSDCAPDKVEEEDNDEVGSWYRKGAEIKPKPVSPTSVPSDGNTRAVSNPLPISRRKDGEKQEKQPWSRQSLSPQSSDLRSIIEQEKNQSLEEDSPINERKKEGKSPLSSKSRISQKERKKLRKSLEEQLSLNKNHKETSDDDVTKTSPSPVPVNPWKSCPNGRPSVSFRELLEEEEEENRDTPAEKEKNERKASMPKECSQNSKSLNSCADLKSTSLSAWQNSKLACSPPNNPVQFDKIQELQEQETVNRERSMKKPLSLIQIEDKALEELLEHYGGRYNPCELIVVERETRPERSPNWVT